MLTVRRYSSVKHDISIFLSKSVLVCSSLKRTSGKFIGGERRREATGLFFEGDRWMRISWACTTDEERDRWGCSIDTERDGWGCSDYISDCDQVDSIWG